MKIHRSTKCTLKFSTKSKLNTLNIILKEYGRVVNCFVDKFWTDCPKKGKLLKGIVNSVNTWLSSRLRKVAAREAIDMIKSVKDKKGKKGNKPKHRGNRIYCSSTITDLNISKESKEFDCWLHLQSIGNKTILDLPIKLHKHFNNLQNKGKRLSSYIITNKYVQFTFEIETGKKKEPNKCIGIDTGINCLCSISNNTQLGKDIKNCIERIKRCKHGSKGQRRATRALHQRMDEVAKDVVRDVDLIVVENLKNITKNTRKRKNKKNCLDLGHKTRYFIGRWNVRYWLDTLQRKCEDNRVSFRSVYPCYTSQTCSSCNHTDKRNRNGEKFLCLNCGYKDNADINAAKNILQRFLTGTYGPGCKT